MNIIEKYLSDLSPTKVRSVCYYLSRKLKQAKILKDYTKDPFIEADSSLPDDEVMAKTKELLFAIEAAESMTADKFDDATYSKWMRTIFEFERGLGLGANSTPTARVQDFLNRGV
ncbi:MAG: hypothetical protein J0H52_00560 [Comamonadaceae bacterium]|nr:hypothetical protein [Comamonadaceae bacterium]